ncbi:T9SS type B sorting domain-containing protein [Parvicella tangerina]|uniref:T9SS type B sorting domain-containing protein n=1 Tax=Parvicella tangerina TaxID=2829795 RepID=UPI00215D399A|nr:gliding motility-associated C-terminal domain-containing protein [Parvicella tangerina]
MKPMYMLKKLNLLSILLTTSLILGASSVFAVKEYVVNTNDSGTGSLRDVIQNANGGDTIIIDVSGVLMLQSQIQINNSLTIIGPGPIHFRIDGSNVTVPLETGFVCHNGSDIYMEGIQFENFSQDPIASGGSYTGVFSVVGCAFDNNSGVINVDGGNLHFSGCSFLNTSGSNPVVFVEANSKFLNCTFYNNAGGGVWVNNGSTDIVNCTFFQNGVNVGSGLAIRQMAGTLNLRNNIIFNDTQTNALIDVSGGTLNSQGGNITNDEVTTGSWVGTDIQSMSVNSGLAIGNKVKDGWGITYFPPTAGSDGIDIDIASNNLPLMDQRRVWRVMDGGVNGAAADAGAVEYSRFTVTSTGTGPGSLWSAWNRYDTLSFSGKAAFVFEVGGVAPFFEGAGFAPISFNRDSTIINGFSQDSSKIPGPGTSPGTITSAYTPIVINNPFGSSGSAIEVYTSGCIVAGLSIGSFTAWQEGAIKITGSGNTISGCHLGVNSTADNITSNTHGVIVLGGSASAHIGSGQYCGKNHHANRNVISGNQSSQVRVVSSSFMKISNNIIGLDGIGLDKPTGTAIASDTGIVTSLYAYTPGSGVLIGSHDIRDRNVIGDQSRGIVLMSNNNKVFNNFIGSDYTGNNVGATTPNDYGIEVADPMYTYYVDNNLIGEQDKGNVIVGSVNEGVVLFDVFNNSVFANKVGVGLDGLTPLGNGFAGIYVDGFNAYDNQIGAPGKGNVISDNGLGIELTSSSYHSIVRSNLIGVGKDSITTLGNANQGIYVWSSSASNAIGGCNPGDGNIIGANFDGIVFEGLGADNDTVMGNYIGVNPAGDAIGNSSAGISFLSAINNIQIGDIGSGCGNEIAYNGVGVQSDGIGNSEMFISGNSFHDNSGIGIDLDGDGQNAPLGDGSPFDNNGAQTPVLNSATTCGGTTTLEMEIELNGSAQIEVFKTSDGEEGDSLIVQQIVAFSSGVPQVITLPTLPAGMELVVTATYDDGGGYKHTSEFTDPITISGPPAALTPSISHTEVCFGGNTYPLLTVPGSTGTAVWFWDAGLTQRIEAGDTINSPEDDLFINGPGTFNYYVVDSVAGCYGTVSSPVTLDIITPPTVAISGQDTLCDVGSGESFTVTSVSGANYNWYLNRGFDPFEINVATNTSNVIVDPAAEPTYMTDSLIVEVDSAGCVMRDTMSLYLVWSPYVDSDSVVQPTTCGGFGEIYLATYEQNTPFTIYYNGGTALNATTDNTSKGYFPMTGLPAGVYNIDSISNGYCNVFVGNVYTLVEPVPQTVYAGPDLTDCEGSTITLSATPSGGTGSFTYNWDNGGGTGQTVNVSPLTSVDYIVTCTDDVTLCEAKDTVTVTINPLPMTDAGVDMDVCIDNGLITLNGSPAGGTWTGTGVSGSDFDPLTAGPGTFTLTYTYTDGNGCTATDDMNMTVNATPDGGNPLVVDVTCHGGSDGSIMLMPLGTYDYAWTGPAGYTSTNQDISGLVAGSYNAVITDPFSGCTGTASGFVNEPSFAPSLTATGTDLTCNGDGSGSIVLSGSSGVTPYQYQIDGGGFSTANTFNGLSAGTYVMSMMDANLCPANDTVVTLTEPTALLVSSTVTSNYNGSDISCPGAADGAVTATASGGTGAPTYDWYTGGTPVGTTQTLSGLAAGTYDLTVTDGNGCTALDAVTLNDPAPLSIDNILTADPTCNGNADGVLEAIVSGGTSLDYIDWYDDAYVTWVSSNNPYTGVAAGTYYIEAVDINGCVTQGGPVTLSDPAALLASFGSTHETCGGLDDGSLYVQNVTGGGSVGGYSTEWFTDPGGVSIGIADSLTGVAVGNYSGTVTDANGCSTSGLVSVNAGETYTAAISATYTDSCINNNSYNFIDGNGVPPSGAASFYWGMANGSPSMSVAQNPTGVVFSWPNSNLGINYEVTSNNGCVFYDTIYIWIYDTADVSLIPTDVSCFGAADGSVTANATGGTGPYTYSFDGNTPTTTNSITGLGAGTYSCYVIDTYSGCQTTTQTVGVAEPSQITFTAAVSDATCGNNNGQVVFQNVTGGTGGYTYSVDGSTYVTGSTISNMAPGSYDFYVQDGSGCIETQNTNTIGNVGNPVPTPLIAEGSPFLVCDDGSNNYGTLTAVSNDVSPGTFEWSMVTLGNVISANDSLVLDDSNTGNHYIYLTESNGTCESPADSVLLSVTANDVVNNSILEFCAGSEVTIDLTTSGDIYWYGGNGEIADTLSAFTTAVPSVAPTTYYYELIIGDCIFNDSITFVEDPDCDGITVVNNAFSPNGDGINDIFKIDANALLSNENSVTIVNRWGDVINEYANYDNTTVAWDGTNRNGEPVPAGTYFYVIEIPSIEFKSTGWIQVVR